MLFFNKMLFISSATIAILFLLHCIPTFWDAYEKQKLLLDNERWREQECSDAVFFKKMKSLGSDFCTHISPFHNSLSQFPVLVALYACLPFKQLISYLYASLLYYLLGDIADSHKDDMWHYIMFWILFTISLYTCYNIVWPIYLLLKEKSDYLQILEECSPQIKQPVRKRPLWRHCGHLFHPQKMD